MLRSRSSRRSPSRRLVRRLGAGLVLALAGLAAAQGLSTPSASADPSASSWAALRSCESSGNYSVVARNGHYGAYQFDQATWRSVGGSGSPQNASRLEQDYRALYLYRMRGWQPWTCARKLGLREDASARSKKVPTYAEARTVSGATGSTPAPTPTPKPTPTPTPTPAPGTGTAWPGAVYRYGDCASALRTFQARMNTLGSPYRFAGTSCYYAQTRTAVVALQKANGIKASGILGPKTWNAAFSTTARNPFTAASAPKAPRASAAKAPAATSRASTVTATTSAPAWPGVVYRTGDCAPGLRAFQQRMNTLGSPYRFTGTSCYQARTRTAVVALQKANGIKASGLLGPQTWKAAFSSTATNPFA